MVREGNKEPCFEITSFDGTQKTLYLEAVEVYENEKRKAFEWQKRMLSHVMAVDDSGMWLHTKVGYSIPRRNGKGEILVMRELWGITHGERILHTAHKTSTSHSAALRLIKELDDCGFTEIIRPKRGQIYEKGYTFAKQYGLEKIVMLDGLNGCIDFRTRTSNGGLGEGFDLLVIDEAQEYQDDQENTLKYTVSDSPNPQTILCGTPPTAISKGTVFKKMRQKIKEGDTAYRYWGEWSVEEMTDVHDIDSWYKTNPSLGTSVLNERKIADEIGDDALDFNIQRLGYWYEYSQKSIISRAQWLELLVECVPKRNGQINIGIKFSKDGNVCMSASFLTDTGHIYVECVDYRNSREGIEWVVQFILQLGEKVNKIVVDGAQGFAIIEKEFKEHSIKGLIIPTVKEIIEANANFELTINQKTICHSNQEPVENVVSNCEKRNIGNNGGFGYRAIRSDCDIGLMDSMILSIWATSNFKEKKKQSVSY